MSGNKKTAPAERNARVPGKMNGISAVDDHAGRERRLVEINLPVLRQQTDRALRSAGRFALSTIRLPKAFLPVVQLVVREDTLSREELAFALDELFTALYTHPMADTSRAFTGYLRRYRLIPNEETTENLIHYMVRQVTSRSPVEIPEQVINEFWDFFQELISAPELKGVLELNLDITRSVLRTYEPLLVDLLNRTKHIRRFNQSAMTDMVQKSRVLRSDLLILRRQIKAIRYIKPFLQTDPKDFATQAQIVAKMVSEFGPLFIKMAQVAAANADFLPEEIARELKVFQQDVEPMSADDVRQAFMESFGKEPHEVYFSLDISRPLRSGSIGSVYLAKRPTVQNGVEVLIPVIVKVSRHNLEREFQMSSLALELMLISSQYWAPHSKLRPFLASMSKQVSEFTRGFEQELDFQSEAQIQTRFHERSLDSGFWSVPRLFNNRGRVIEMEYLDTARSVEQLLTELPARERPRFQRSIGRDFVHAVLQHVLWYQEFHGDLHPGNIMVDSYGHLFLIDWGKTVDMEGKWAQVGQYLRGALTGDVDALADSLIAMSTQPEENQQRRAAIRAALAETLDKKHVERLRGVPWKPRFWLQLKGEGLSGLQRRLQAVMHLLSNTYQLGIIVQSDYLHLSRSLSAMVATYLHIQQKRSGLMITGNLLMDLGLFAPRMTYLGARKQATRALVKVFKK
ncbi:AarF/ABC1/UbiB kinase family protein [Allohahella marinimesophila]|uniref:Protein kinase domain-containing protein n=1 Tax=Allohahella marinimesophila TaxID=1054972 RepID=A0ABP7Q6P5_9GAMM